MIDIYAGLIKTAFKVFSYQRPNLPWGMKHDVYFDRNVNEFVIADFPKEGSSFHVTNIEVGLAEATVWETTHKIRVIEE
jgi:hypothetical protein